MATKKQVRDWEEAYHHYGASSEVVARTWQINATTAQDMASASWAVANSWRSIAGNPELPWWMLAALESAAQAFEEQAHHWHSRSTDGVCGIASVRSGTQRRG
jgi:hypothetical protein